MSSTSASTSDSTINFAAGTARTRAPKDNRPGRVARVSRPEFFRASGFLLDVLRRLGRPTMKHVMLGVIVALQFLVASAAQGLPAAGARAAAHAGGLRQVSYDKLEDFVNDTDEHKTGLR